MELSAIHSISDSASVQRTSAVIKKAPAEKLQSVKTEAAMFSQEEKKYFSNIYPIQAKEIARYGVYAKNGNTQASQLGTIIDSKS